MKHSMQIEIVIMATIFLVALGGAAGLAQEAPPRPAMSQGVTEEGLRDRLQQNVREREELLRELEDITRRRDEALPVEEKPQRYQETAGPQAESTNAPDAIPVYDLADISIVSKRVQKLPEGLAFSATPRSETDSQPTRTMKESMESLPGVILRSANGPRDFGVSIRGVRREDDRRCARPQIL